MSRGLLGAPDRGLQPVEGKRPAIVAEKVLPCPMRDHEAGNTGPWRATPRAQAEIERAASDDRGSNGGVHFPAHAGVDVAVGPFPGHPFVEAFAAVPHWRCLPHIRAAANPSRDIDTSSTTLLIA